MNLCHQRRECAPPALELRELDLNLLLVFDRMLALKRVSAVAQALGLSQPAVSNSLARLRKALGDELFVRSAHGMAPTPFAQQLAEPVTHAMAALHGAVNRERSFDAATSQRSFTLAMTDIGEIYFAPRLMELLSRTAPGVTLSTVRNTAINLGEAMEGGTVDLAIGLLPQLQAGFFQRRLFMQRYVCLLRAAHPLAAKARLSLKDFCAAEHLLVQAAGTGHGQADEVMKAQGIARRVRLAVPHFVALGHLLQSSDMIATVPEKLAQSLSEPFGLVWRTHPVALPQIAINCFWHGRFHRDAGNQWLRALVFESFGA